MAVKEFTNRQLGQWAADEARKAVEWHKAQRADVSAAELEAYRVGMVQGFGVAVGLFKLHGAIVERYL